MAAAYPKSETPDIFSGAHEQMHTMEEHLRSDAAFASDHAELERYVKERGHEIERRMLQAHLDLRAARERPVDVHGADGVRRTTRRESSRVLLTIVGEVEVKRWEYEAKGVSALHPADAALNLPPGRYSFGVQRLVVEEACKSSFDEVFEQTKKIIGVAVPKRQLEELTIQVARDFTTFYATRAVKAEDTIALLVFGFDAKGVVMRHDDLRVNEDQVEHLATESGAAALEAVAHTRDRKVIGRAPVLEYLADLGRKHKLVMAPAQASSNPTFAQPVGRRRVSDVYRVLIISGLEAMEKKKPPSAKGPRGHPFIRGERGSSH